MDMIVDIVSWVLLVSGSVFVVIGAIGLIRLPDVYTRLHGVGVTDTLGAGLILAGLMVQSGFTLISAKLALILVFILFTSPASSHALARTALYGGQKPLVDDGDDTPEPATDTDKKEA